MAKITPFLWFDDALEEAMNFYVSIFGDARIIHASRYGDGGPRPKGSLMSATFELEGQTFMALNGGPMFKFTEAVSFFVKCETQAEVDYFWDKLIEGGGEARRCGWLKDRFGLSWQIIPDALGRYLSDSDPAKAQRAMAAMMGMNRIDVAALKAAYEG